MFIYYSRSTDIPPLPVVLQYYNNYYGGSYWPLFPKFNSLVISKRQILLLFRLHNPLSSSALTDMCLGKFDLGLLITAPHLSLVHQPLENASVPKPTIKSSMFPKV